MVQIFSTKIYFQTVLFVLLNRCAYLRHTPTEQRQRKRQECLQMFECLTQGTEKLLETRLNIDMVSEALRERVTLL